MKTKKISLVVKFLGALALLLSVLGVVTYIGATGLTRGGEQTADVAGELDEIAGVLSDLREAGELRELGDERAVAKTRALLEELASRYKVADGNGNGAYAHTQE